ncbi:Domain of unknown function DUF1691 [Ceraceosorus bombacis]|uniref:Mitochondrial adapter protein MCP1 transmembrane domain-containing protein n=1 Tax=Ceraceosorus bombacis TaxID=401625 RepID=A0A0P1BE32_9BASI|nr:Domain of unknown function DUF1691 [Ceraceosorus bombacis]
MSREAAAGSKSHASSPPTFSHPHAVAQKQPSTRLSAGPAERPRSAARRMDVWLRRISHLSASAFGVFVILHISAPVVAAIAPPNSAQEWAGKTMLLGRVYYQGAWSEPVLVWAMLGAHISSSLSRRLLRSTASTTSPVAQRIKAPSSHTTSAIILLPLLALHSLTTRLIPARKGVSEVLDHSFVARGFQTWPLLSCGSYAALLGAMLIHSIGGARRIYSACRPTLRNWRLGRASNAAASDALLHLARKDERGARALARKTDARINGKRRSDATLLGAGIASLWLALGLTRIVADGADLGPVMLAKYDACYLAVWPYRAVRRVGR